MEALATLNNQRQFDFQNNGIEVMDLETLQRTYKENDIYGNPVRGIYHYQVIQRMTDICRRHNLNYEVEEIFAAQNKNRTQPGVVILPQVEQTYGEKAVEAHVLRRIFTTIRILNGDTDELTTTLVVAYHQDGIQAAIGPCVRICHNQCILSPERSVANYGKDKVTTEELFGKVDDWMRNFERDMDADRSRIQRLKEKVLTPGELYMIIGMLTALRVSHDSADKRLASQVDTYPLNQGQISVFTEELLKLSLEQPRITAWDSGNEEALGCNGRKGTGFDCQFKECQYLQCRRRRKGRSNVQADRWCTGHCTGRSNGYVHRCHRADFAVRAD